MRYQFNKPNQDSNIIRGRFAIRFPYKNRSIVCDLVTDEAIAIRKAQLIGGHVFDTETRQVWSEQTGQWLSEEAHAIITGEFSKTGAPDYACVGMALLQNEILGGAR